MQPLSDIVIKMSSPCNCKAKGCSECTSLCVRCGCDYNGSPKGARKVGRPAMTDELKALKKRQVRTQMRRGTRRAGLEASKVISGSVNQESQPGSAAGQSGGHGIDAPMDAVKSMETVSDVWHTFEFTSSMQKNLPSKAVRVQGLCEPHGRGWSTLVQRGGRE